MQLKYIATLTWVDLEAAGWVEWVDLGVADLGAEAKLEEGCNRAQHFSILTNTSDQTFKAGRCSSSLCVVLSGSHAPYVPAMEG